MAVLQFKFDESFDRQIMVVGGWIADELQWKSLEGSWQRYIDAENEISGPDQQITRFHATEMNCKGGEFKHWDHQRCIRFSRKLINVIAKRRMGAIAIACDMDAIQEVWPKGERPTLQRRAYVVCMKQLMVEIAHIMQEYFPGDTVLLIHDHGNWDMEALEGYNLMIDEPEWKSRDLFEGILPKTGAQAIGLQAADMIAYEVFKGVKAKTNNPEAAMRGAMKEILSKDIAISAKWIDLGAAKALYRRMKESGKYPDLDTKGIA